MSLISIHTKTKEANTIDELKAAMLDLIEELQDNENQADMVEDTTDMRDEINDIKQKLQNVKHALEE